MTWEIPVEADNAWGGDGAVGATIGTGAWTNTAKESFNGIDPQHVSKHDGADPDNTCRTCGQEGHFSRECPDGVPNSGECYNCGQQGHNKADCPNEHVEQDFTGECRHCGMVGHRIAECPTAPPKLCKRCNIEGHSATECTNAYKIIDDDVPIVHPDRAWDAVLAADAERDLPEFKEAFIIYCKAAPQMDFNSLQIAMREIHLNTWLVAIEKEASDVHAIVNLQGKSDCKYVVSYQYGLEPRRKASAEGWPKTEEENLERLKDAGFVKDGGIPKCSNCEGMGHMAKDCTEEKREREKLEITCHNCNEKGHYVRDCPAPRVDRNACRNCGQSGHRANDCTEPRSAENVECRKCLKMGHFSKDCPDAPKFECRNCGQEGHRASDCTEERKMTCRNCNGEGHVSRECPEPKNMDNMKCRNCDEMGHGSRNCPKPTDYGRIMCRNCGDMGHGAARCKNPPKEEDEARAGTFDAISLNNAEGSVQPGASNAWETTAPAVEETSGDTKAWGATPDTADAW